MSPFLWMAVVNNLVNKFFGDLRELSVSPETTALRNVVQSSGEALAGGVKNMFSDLESMKQDLDYRIEDSITQVNALTRELAELNKNISEFLNLNTFLNIYFCIF